MCKTERVSIVILNWNGTKYIDKCIESVLAQTYKEIEIIIVDNNSIDGSIQKIQKTYPFFRYVLNDCNLGFAKGMNKGIEIATGKFVVALNLDVFLKNDFIEICVKKAYKNSNIGGVGGKELAWNNGELTKTISSSGGPGYLKKRGQGFFGHNYNKEQYCFGVMGSFPFFKKDALESVKSVSNYYFDPDFETGWEDKDLYFRLHLKKWSFLYAPDAIGWHVGSGSADGEKKLIHKNLEYQKKVFRNRYYFIIKNYPSILLNWLFFSLLITEFLLPLYFLVKAPKSFIALCLARIELIKSWKSLIKKRKNIQKNIQINPKDLKIFFKKF